MSSVNITGGSITGITDLAITDGGTGGGGSAAAARTNPWCCYRDQTFLPMMQTYKLLLRLLLYQPQTVVRIEL